MRNSLIFISVTVTSALVLAEPANRDRAASSCLPSGNASAFRTVGNSYSMPTVDGQMLLVQDYDSGEVQVIDLGTRESKEIKLPPKTFIASSGPRFYANESIPGAENIKTSKEVVKVFDQARRRRSKTCGNSSRAERLEKNRCITLSKKLTLTGMRKIYSEFRRQPH